MTVPAPLPAPFDFDNHRRHARDGFQQVRPLYEEFAATVESILAQALDAEAITIASIQARAKDLDSFADKAATVSDADPNRPKYSDPLKEITDLAGARIIGFFPSTVNAVDRVIKAQFTVLERADKGDSLRQQGRFGYQSVHYLVSLTSQRTALPEYARFRGLVAEVQVRTILQHAWAEIEHDIQPESCVKTRDFRATADRCWPARPSTLWPFQGRES